MTGIRVALVGASYVAATRMMPAFKSQGVEVAAVWDAQPHRLARWSQTGVMLTDDLDAVLDSDVDAVYISSANADHASQAIAAASAGKHVLLDKPMATTLADAREVVAVADRMGVHLAVSHHLPGSPLHSAARDLVHAGRIGDLLSARINHAVLLPESLRGWRLDAAPGGGVIFDITVHDAAVLNQLFGAAPVAVTAIGVTQAAWNDHGGVDAVMTVMEYAGAHGRPALAQTHDAFTVAYPGTGMEIHGTDGAIIIGDAMTQESAGTVTVINADGEQSVDVDCSETLYDIIVRRFVGMLRGEGAPTVTAQQGLDAMAVAVAADRSVTIGSTVALADL